MGARGLTRRRAVVLRARSRWVLVAAWAMFLGYSLWWAVTAIQDFHENGPAGVVYVPLGLASCFFIARAWRQGLRVESSKITTMSPFRSKSYDVVKPVKVDVVSFGDVFPGYFVAIKMANGETIDGEVAATFTRASSERKARRIKHLLDA